MVVTTIAHTTDSHLGQKLNFENGPNGIKVNYIDNRTEHLQNNTQQFNPNRFIFIDFSFAISYTSSV